MLPSIFLQVGRVFIHVLTSKCRTKKVKGGKVIRFPSRRGVGETKKQIVGNALDGIPY